MQGKALAASSLAVAALGAVLYQTAVYSGFRFSSSTELNSEHAVELAEEQRVMASCLYMELLLIPVLSSGCAAGGCPRLLQTTAARRATERPSMTNDLLHLGLLRLHFSGSAGVHDAAAGLGRCRLKVLMTMHCRHWDH